MKLLRTLKAIIEEIPDFLTWKMEKMAKELQYLTMCGREYWHVTDFRETFYAVPVAVICKNKGPEILAVWEQEDGTTHEFWIADMDELYPYWEEAHDEARRRNQEMEREGLKL